MGERKGSRMRTQGPTGLSDERIVELYWRRDEAAIRETDRKYGALLTGIATRFLHDEQDAEECRNDTYLGAWNAIPPTRPAVLPAFLTQIMRRVAINRYKERSAKRRVPSELTVSMEELSAVLGSGQTPETSLEAEELGRLISGYARGLPARRRYIFIGRFYLAEPVETIAGELSISVPTVYRELQSIKQGLREFLERNDVTL